MQTDDPAHLAKAFRDPRDSLQLGPAMVQQHQQQPGALHQQPAAHIRPEGEGSAGLWPWRWPWRWQPLEGSERGWKAEEA